MSKTPGKPSMHDRSISRIVCSILFLPLLAAVGSCASPSAPSAAVVAISPTSPADDWQESAPAEQGMDAAVLAKLQQHLSDPASAIRSVLIVRHQRLVFEHYKQGLNRDDLHEVHSITKSVTAVLVGIALGRSDLQSLDQKLIDFMPEHADLTADPKIKDVTLRHLLTMTSGFEWSEQAKDECLNLKLGSCSASFLGFATNDWIGVAIKRPLAHAPAQVFNYDSPASHLLSVVLSRAAKTNTAAFAEQQLFAPLGISKYRWPTDNRGINYGAYGLELTARDMAKLGQLYLNRGVWHGEQLVPSDFIDASTHKQTAGGPPARADYGYLWWVTPSTDNVAAYFASGKYGQYILVVPNLDMVVVITSNPGPQRTTGIVREFVLRAVTN